MKSALEKARSYCLIGPTDCVGRTAIAHEIHLTPHSLAEIIRTERNAVLDEAIMMLRKKRDKLDEVEAELGVHASLDSADIGYLEEELRALKEKP